MRTALTELLGIPHPIVGFNRSDHEQTIADCEQRITELGAIL